MNNDLISRSALKKEFNLNFGGVSHAVIAGRIIDNAPAADVAPVVHGEWVKEDDYYCCSKCGQAISILCVSWYKFCPNCGAKMDGEREGEAT